MVWETVKHEGKKIAGFNHWPNPVDWVTDIKVLVCNQDTWIAEINLFAALAAKWFWTNVIPGPRELERKFMTGGYRCGFYIDVKVKSPISIIFGEGTGRVIAEIAGPVATAFFWIWAEQASIEALSAWQTLLYPQEFCQDHIGDGLRRADHGVLGQGHWEGVPGLGVFVFDAYEYLSLGAALVSLPAGYWSVYAAWIVDASPWITSNLKLGFHADSVPVGMWEAGDTTPGLPTQRITQASGYSDHGQVIEAWMEGDRPLGSFPQNITCVMFTYTWSPNPWPGWKDALQGPPTPVQPLNLPLCEWFD